MFGQRVLQSQQHNFTAIVGRWKPGRAKVAKLQSCPHQEVRSLLTLEHEFKNTKMQAAMQRRLYCVQLSFDEMFLSFADGYRGPTKIHKRF
jgi:hypothetical protein